MMRVQLQCPIEIGQRRFEFSLGGEHFGPAEKPLRLVGIRLCCRRGILQGAIEGIQLKVEPGPPHEGDRSPRIAPDGFVVIGEGLFSTSAQVVAHSAVEVDFRRGWIAGKILGVIGDGRFVLLLLMMNLGAP